MKLSLRSPNDFAPVVFLRDNSTRLMVADGWLTLIHICLYILKVLPRSDLPDASLGHPSSAAIDGGTGKFSL